MTKHAKLITILACAMFTLTTGAHAAVPAKIVSETIELIVKKNTGKAVSSASKIAAEKTLLEAVKRSGDDVIKFVESGGMKALECGQKYGDDFWGLCRKYPQASAQIANDAETLIPLVKRAGNEVVDIELKAPGLAKELVETYGEAEVKTLARMESGELAKLYAVAKHQPVKSSKIFDAYRKDSSVLQKLTPMQILALGGGIGVGSGVYQVGDGIQKGLTTVAQESPAIFSVTTIGIIVGSLMALWLFFCRGIKKIFKFMKAMVNKHKTKEINRPARHANMKGENQ